MHLAAGMNSDDFNNKVRWVPFNLQTLHLKHTPVLCGHCVSQQLLNYHRCNGLSLTVWGYTNNYSNNTDWQVSFIVISMSPLSALRGAGLLVTANQMEGWRFLTQQQLSVITHCSTTLRWLCPSPIVQSCCLVLLISVHGLQWFYELRRR